jgi:hypothetical protein
MKTANESFENVASGTTVTNQNCSNEEVKSKLNSENVCYHSVQNVCHHSVQISLFSIWYRQD